MILSLSNASVFDFKNRTLSINLIVFHRNKRYFGTEILLEILWNLYFRKDFCNHEITPPLVATLYS